MTSPKTRKYIATVLGVVVLKKICTKWEYREDLTSADPMEGLTSSTCHCAYEYTEGGRKGEIDTSHKTVSGWTTCSSCKVLCRLIRIRIFSSRRATKSETAQYGE